MAHIVGLLLMVANAAVPVTGAVTAAASAPTLAAPLAPNSCARVARTLTRDLTRARLLKQPETAVGAVHQEATRASSTCADDETLAYLRLRSAELGAGQPFGATPAQVDWRRLARDLAPRFPRSARVTTVAARADGSVETARAALALDPKYVPAHVALALAQTKGGDAIAALATLQAVKNLAAAADGIVVLARVRLDGGDTAGAIQTAKRALRAPGGDTVEPHAADPRPTAEAHAILGLGYLKLGQKGDAARELTLAAPHSQAARDLIAHAEPDLRRELQTLPAPRAH